MLTQWFLWGIDSIDSIKYWTSTTATNVMSIFQKLGHAAVAAGDRLISQGTP